MIIVSQDKGKIINFDNVCNINTYKEEIIAYYNIGNIKVGKYKTEERAKEVLQEIVNKYRQWNVDNNKANTIIPKVYEMPKE